MAWPSEPVKILSGPCAEVEMQLNRLLEYYAIATFSFSEKSDQVTASVLLLNRRAPNAGLLRPNGPIGPRG